MATPYLDQFFRLKIAGAVALLALAIYGWMGAARGHTIYSLGLGIMAVAAAARAMAEHSGKRIYRDAYLVLGGLVCGLVLTPLLLRVLGT